MRLANQQRNTRIAQSQNNTQGFKTLKYTTKNKVCDWKATAHHQVSRFWSQYSKNNNGDDCGDKVIHCTRTG